MTQQDLIDEVLTDTPRMFRNNRGVFATEYTDKSGRRRQHFIRCGIPEPSGRESDAALKGGDMIGWTETVITADMVGRKVAVFTSIEVKTEGDTIKSGQIGWHNLVLDCGGRSEIWKARGNRIEKIKEKV